MLSVWNSARHIEHIEKKSLSGAKSGRQAVRDEAQNRCFLAVRGVYKRHLHLAVRGKVKIDNNPCIADINSCSYLFAGQLTELPGNGLRVLLHEG